MVELVVVMSILIVVMSLVVSAGRGIIQANRKSLQQASFDILDQVLDDFARQNPLKGLRNEKGGMQMPWKVFFSKYPPVDLSEVSPAFSSGGFAESINLAGRNIHQRIMGTFTDPLPAILPGARIRVGDEGTLADSESEEAYDDTESFLFYVNFYAPALGARLQELADRMIANRDRDWVDVDDDGEAGEGDIALTELYDVWGRPLLYLNDGRDRFDNLTGATGHDGRIDNPLVEANHNKPVFVSAGPDGFFTAGDLIPPGADAPPSDPLADNIYSLPRVAVEGLDPEELSKLLHYDFEKRRWMPQ